jgi:hypothetical protein
MDGLEYQRNQAGNESRRKHKTAKISQFALPWTGIKAINNRMVKRLKR